MKSKILNISLVFTSLAGYLEWGKDNHLFLIQAEMEIISKLISDPLAVVHPFILLPFAGQLILLITLFQKKPGKLLTFAGLGCIGLLLAFMFVIGLISLNIKILASTIPFVCTGILVIMYHIKNSDRVVNG
ncbi:MAG: hypothetical protein K1X61_06005 [Chitinophagales bacterium]|nr:hypothetical protein [Chitinophagales bacterium]